MTPKRIQRRRTKGWKMPPNTIAVTRPNKWGNPFRVGMVFPVGDYLCTIKTPAEAVALFRAFVECRPSRVKLIREKLRGKNLACWCPLIDKDGHPCPCHADVLLEIANT